ncbi:hypothetical protein C483_04324 [Natrialba hulunbeirensis JCM 10989]|uniref:Polyprenyl synthetase n=1 Tax=Natrialba hulunbeirensis JCM 10989 TaxID=1227493 RepID=M0A5N5_9EURY|nr:hypothetical protein [Natrialba hulunbeirensis]ELY93874.1 hypothetical protein C483_04324 [Natrialba hulunbeirensis JCM 10989]
MENESTIGHRSPLVPPVPALDSKTDPITDREQDPVPESVTDTDLLARYEAILGDRGYSSWRWLYSAFPEFRLSCVPDEYGSRVRTAKLLSTLFITIADDVAELHDDRATFAQLANVPFDSQRADAERAGVDGPVVDLAIDVWCRFRELYDASPRADEFADLLTFDLRQVFDAIEYSLLANRDPDLVSEQELWTYDSYNMMVYVHALTDLANAPTFDRAELASLRQVLDRTQRMARIGNWLATWRRELAEGDYSSGVVIRAVETGVIERDALDGVYSSPGSETETNQDTEAQTDTGTKTDAGRDTGAEPAPTKDVDALIQAIEDSSVEAYFLDRWHVECADAARFDDTLASVDLGAYLDGLQTVLCSHIGKRNAVR